MPITFDIEAEEGVVVVTMAGTLTRDDLIGFFTALPMESGQGEPMGRLVISTDVVAYPPPAEMGDLVERMRRRTAGNPPRFAVVATTPLAIGMANMFMGQAGLGHRFEIFPDEESARTWLRLSNEP